MDKVLQDNLQGKDRIFKLAREILTGVQKEALTITPEEKARHEAMLKRKARVAQVRSMNPGVVNLYPQSAVFAGSRAKLPSPTSSKTITKSNLKNIFSVVKAFKR